MRYFLCFSFMCEFCFLYCDTVWLGAVYEFGLVFDAYYVDLKHDTVFVIWLIVVCEWVFCW